MLTNEVASKISSSECVYNFNSIGTIMHYHKTPNKGCIHGGNILGPPLLRLVYFTLIPSHTKTLGSFHNVIYI